MSKHSFASATWNKHLSRREMVKGGVALGAGAPAIALLGSGAPNAVHAQEGSGARGGTLNVALIGEPPTLDVQATTATIVGLITWNIFEPLFTFSPDYEIIPMLAESHEASDDGMINTVTLRQGVLFHNGAEMTSADVIASFNRWAAGSGIGGNLQAAIEELVAVDDYTLEFRMSQPYGSFLPSLSQNFQGLAIYPASVIEAAGDGLLTEYIGTGPYRFVEQLPDQYIRFARFDDYVALEGEPNGYGGHKYQYVDEILFIPVPDEAARIAGLQAGDYHYLESISPDQSTELANAANVRVEVLPPTGWETFVLNWRSPLMSNVTLRRAFQAALDHEPILFGSQGEGFYRIDPGVMLLETEWHSTAAEELYNVADPEQARALLEEAGYDGTPLRFMTTQEYNDQYNAAVIGSQQLEAAGFTVELEIYDWATLLERRTDPELWDVLTTGISFKPDPSMLSILQLGTWPGWWESEPSMTAFNTMQSELEFEARFAAWEGLQQLFYEEVPMIKTGDSNAVTAVSTQVQGLTTQTQLGVAFWNIWLEQ